PVECGQRSRQCALVFCGRLCDDLFTPHPAIEDVGVEVGAQHERQCEQAGDCEHVRAGLIPERGEESGVHEEVDLGVEVATECGRATGRTSQLAFRVVQQRLRLQEQRAGDQVTPGD